MNQPQAQHYNHLVQTKEEMMKELFNLLTVDHEI